MPKTNGAPARSSVTFFDTVVAMPPRTDARAQSVYKLTKAYFLEMVGRFERGYVEQNEFLRKGISDTEVAAAKKKAEDIRDEYRDRQFKNKAKQDGPKIRLGQKNRFSRQRA